MVLMVSGSTVLQEKNRSVASTGFDVLAAPPEVFFDDLDDCWVNALPGSLDGIRCRLIDFAVVLDRDMNITADN